jgi:GT2 family glycosyltransferase
MRYNKLIADHSWIRLEVEYRPMKMNAQSNPESDLYPLYVVILNWNLPDDTIACVRSLRADASSGVEVIIVDNASTDDSLQRFRDQLGDTVTIIVNGANLGFAGGVNAGIHHALNAGAGSVLLLNNDTLVDPTMLDRLISAASELPNADILGPVIYYHQPPDRIWRAADQEQRWMPIPLRMADRAIVRATAPFHADYVTACGVLISRNVFEAIGLFDENYFMYFEDADFCRRARAAGFGIWCVPAARMWHKVSLSARKDKPANRYAMAWGRARFYRRHPHGPSAALTTLYLLWKLAWSTLADARAGDWELVRPLWAGTWDGYRDRPSRRTAFSQMASRP